jgi:hypothetical protein
MISNPLESIELMMKIPFKHLSILVTCFVLMSAAAFAGVSVSAPTPGSTSGSPVHFVAWATGSAPISAMRIYVDGKSMYAGSGGKVNTFLGMGNGRHSVDIQAWDTRGHFYRSAFQINVGSSPQGASTTASSNVFYQIERMGGWEHCVECAGPGGYGPGAWIELKQGVSAPSLNGSSAQFSIASGNGYANGLWWKQLGGNNGITHFQYDLDFYLTTPQFSEALEFDVNQTANNRKFIFGTQCGVNYDHQWDVWDTAGSRWRPTGVPCSVSAYKWHHLTWQFYRDSGYTHFVSVTMDGVTHYINYSFASKAWGSGSEINVAFQMDGDISTHYYSVWLNNVTLRQW